MLEEESAASLSKMCRAKAGDPYGTGWRDGDGWVRKERWCVESDGLHFRHEVTFLSKSNPFNKTFGLVCERPQHLE